MKKKTEINFVIEPVEVEPLDNSIDARRERVNDYVYGLLTEIDWIVPSVRDGWRHPVTDEYVAVRKALEQYFTDWDNDSALAVLNALPGLIPLMMGILAKNLKFYHRMLSRELTPALWEQTVDKEVE